MRIRSPQSRHIVTNTHGAVVNFCYAGPTSALRMSSRPSYAATRMGAYDILLVDDDDDLRDLLAELLRARGFAVEVSKHGAEALSVLDRGDGLPRMILLDYMMPVLDGPGFLAATRRDPRVARIPVVILTAMGDAARDPACAPAVACLRKPLPFPDLLRAIQKVLGAPAELER